MRSKLGRRGTLICLMGLSLVGCQSKAGTGALVGGAGGAAAGAAIGSVSHSRAGEGALIGAAVGALGGALIGHSMDKADEKRDAAEADSRYSAERNYDRAHAVPVSDEKVTKADVIRWTQRGVHDEVIIDRIERGNMVFRLTAADRNELRDRGVSESVIQAMEATARK
jgi:hypothetical protein